MEPIIRPALVRWKLKNSRLAIISAYTPMHITLGSAFSFLAIRPEVMEPAMENREYTVMMVPACTPVRPAVAEAAPLVMNLLAQVEYPGGTAMNRKPARDRMRIWGLVK